MSQPTTVTRTFSTQILRDWEVDYCEDCALVVACDFVRSPDASYSACEIVFRAPDDSKLWRFTYLFSAISGSSNLTEYTTVDAVEVEPYTAQVTRFRAVTEDER